jgi:purine-binding chemotaxis protein CheW
LLLRFIEGDQAMPSGDEFMSRSSNDSKSNAGPSRKYLVFMLNGHLYGTPLSDIKEIIGLPEFVPVPQNPDYLLGLINLRGRVISAIDLKKKLDMKKTAEIKRPAVILVEDGTKVVGCVVDAIKEVLSIRDEEIEAEIRDSVPFPSRYLKGAARFADGPMILMLDLKRIAAMENSSANATGAAA